jgi:two-component system sensor histidine kinase MprB
VTLRTRLTVLVSVAVGLAVVLVAVVATLTTRNELRESVDAGLRQRAEVVVDPPRGRPGPPGGRGGDPLNTAETTTRVFRADGQVVSGVADTDETPLTDRDLAVAAGTEGPYYRDLDLEGSHLRIYTAPAGPSQAVQVARSVDELDATIRDLSVIYAVIGIIGVVAAAGVGWAVARRSLRPVADLTAAAERVAEQQDLSSEIEVEREDEVGRLASSFNAMLRALRSSRDQQQQLVADASHELRTPLTSLRTNIEVLEREQALPAAERVELLDDVRAELEELTSLVAELVELASGDDAGEPAEPAVEVQLDEVVRRVAGRAERRNGHPIELDLEPTTVVGRSSRLERAVGNLLDNAAKWSPDGASIRVALAGGTLMVEDQGPGIEPADRARVFDRFYRAAAARSQPGSGLGLAIVRQVVDDHGGTVLVDESPSGGAAVGFRLPTTP